MRHIEGYVCAAVTAYDPTLTTLYGKNTGNGDGLLESITTNGLIPFKKTSELQRAYQELLIKKRATGLYKSTNQAQIEMNIAESLEEFDAVNHQNNFVVLLKDPESKLITFLSVYSPKAMKCGYIGYDFFTNGLKTIKKFDDAYRIAVEALRQAQCPVSLATFSLRKPIGKFILS